MDLHFLSAEPTETERTAVDGLLGPPTSGWDGGVLQAHDLHVARNGHGFDHGVRRQRDLLLPALHAVNDRVGWISAGALNYVCERLDVPPAEAYGVATFYAMFSMKDRPRRVVHLCTDLACRAKGSQALEAALHEDVGPPGEPHDGPGVVWHESPCLGLCERAPAALAIEAGDPPGTQVVGPTTAGEVTGLTRSGRGGTGQGAGERDGAEPPVGAAVPQAGEPGLVLLKRIGTVDPESLDDYRAHGGYLALRRALQLGPAGVIREVLDSGLMGRGGAAFPTGRKWDATARQPDRPHYLVCNADESEPGTFKDRVVMEGDPFAVIEAMTVAGYATGCQRGYVYIRGEYPRARRRLEHAISEASARGLLGRDIMGHGYDFEIEVRRGAGAYICGEETAIFNSIEGYRGEPRNKPPFPVEKGLFGKPTVVNNVETLVNVLPILTDGGLAFASVGTEKSTGTRLFCLSGSVRRPGVYEVESGTTLRALIDLAGGVPEGATMRTVLLGGAAGGFVRPDELDLPLTFEDARAAGTTLGSGVVLVLDDTVELPGILLRIAAFFRDESCGQCVPCRVGTVRQEEALQRLAVGGAGAAADGNGDIDLLREVGRAMRDASICGLGQTAWNAVESAIDRIGVFTDDSTGQSALPSNRHST
ncbi:MAG: NAD(P)H-dependent oxidoreductase subunit E [Carbonactinosporaceae bacterium]